MPYFFNGQLHTTPATMSAIDDSAMANHNLAVGNVMAIIGLAEGGEPKTALRFGNPTDARKVLRSGELAESVSKAFAASTQVGSPATVIAVRVNPATQASLSLNDSSATPVINLVSTDYGRYTNQIKVKVEAGSNKGLLLTTQLGNAYYSEDNVARDAFSIQYTGALASAVMTIDNSTLTLEAPVGTPVASVQLADYPTVQQLVDYMNTISGFSAAVLNGNGNTATPNALDSLSNQDVKLASYTATANLQAAIDWFNGMSELFVTASRPAGVGDLPTPTNWTYLAGGSDGVTTNTDWSDALTALQTEDVQWLAAMSGDGSIRAMVDAHCHYMSTTAEMERRAILGEPIGTSDANAITDALALNSDRSSLVHIGHYDYDPSGALTLYPSYMTAALVAAGFAGMNPGQSMTNKSIDVRGLERDLRVPTDTDPLIIGGVLPIIKTKNGYKVSKAISTWLNNSKYDKVEVSTGTALDYTARSVREALDPLRGDIGSPELLSLVVSDTETTLKELASPAPAGIGVLVGDASNPAYKNITASVQGDVISVSFQCSPGIPANYIAVTIYSKPYSGTASAGGATAA
jgi:hypothetical protein